MSSDNATRSAALLRVRAASCGISGSNSEWTLLSRLHSVGLRPLPPDLSLYPPDKWKDVGLDLVDSEDPKRELEGFSYADIPDPEQGAQG